MNLFDLIIVTIVTIVTKINHPNMTPCDCSAIFDDVITLKLNKIM
jgi:hypothetical protein